MTGFGFSYPEPYDDFPLSDIERAWLDAEADRRAHHALRIAYAAGANDMQRAVLDHLGALPPMPDAAERKARVERIAAERLQARMDQIDMCRGERNVAAGRDPGYVYPGKKDAPILTDWVDGRPWHVRAGYRCRGWSKRLAGELVPVTCPGLVIFGLDHKWHHYEVVNDNALHVPYPADDDPIGTDL
jgi:hypothetical protein